VVKRCGGQTPRHIRGVLVNLVEAVAASEKVVKWSKSTFRGPRSQREDRREDGRIARIGLGARLMCSAGYRDVP
jgi:hypothetical protein